MTEPRIPNEKSFVWCVPAFFGIRPFDIRHFKSARVAHEDAHRHLAASRSAHGPANCPVATVRRHTESTFRPFDALAESIAYQQLSGKAAATIWSRVRALFPRPKIHRPTARVAKTKQKTASGRVSREAKSPRSRISPRKRSTAPSHPRRDAGKMSDEEIIERLITSAVSDVARPWKCCSLFDLGRPDVWPDSRLRRTKRFRQNFWAPKSSPKRNN